MTKSRFDVVPQGGLCNRLRVTLSARFAGETAGRAVRVRWGVRDAECPAAFDELFHSIDTPAFSIVRRPWRYAAVTRRNLHLPALLRLPLFDAQQKNFDPRRHGDIATWLRRYPRLYVSGCEELVPYPAACMGLLRPLPHIQERIDAVTRQFDAHTVGVHIRRTDHTWAIEESTDDAFRQAMHDCVRADGHTRFFLATDDDELKRRLVAEWPERIITQPSVAPRHTSEGIVQAVIDLWCLAATRSLLGSFYSSFTDMAAALGGIPLTVVRITDGTPDAPECLCDEGG